MWKTALRIILKRLGYDLVAHEQPAVRVFLNLMRARAQLVSGDGSLRDRFLQFCAERFTESHAQLFQDLFASFITNGATDGYFVEFGAADGVYLSNTLFLEHQGWRGVVAEPGRDWQAALATHRSCTIELRCVWTNTGETLIFNQPAQAELSTIKSFSGGDSHAASRSGGGEYLVHTVSLLDMLHDAKAPPVIDYLSIDTEGSELAILQAFDFTRYSISIITVEHNFKNSDRTALNDLLTSNGFVRVMTDLSQFDDWYVSSEILARI